jgi:hypothetical protein
MTLQDQTVIFRCGIELHGLWTVIDDDVVVPNQRVG